MKGIFAVDLLVLVVITAAVVTARRRRPRNRLAEQPTLEALEEQRHTDDPDFKITPGINPTSGGASSFDRSAVQGSTPDRPKEHENWEARSMLTGDTTSIGP
jgi:hypothetical protein